ncbi:MAG: tetratricopeptide repeat protein [Pseudonocardiaceae bacterium]
MSKHSLRAAFTLGRQSAVAAQQVFTDRVAEIAAFDASLESLQRSLSVAELSPVIDRSLPRTNVLAYFGVGGIGKTALSQELEHRFTGQDQGSMGPRAAIRFDFAETSAFDIESYVLQLRAGFGHLARSWPAFDMAFGVYWERAHPGKPLQEFINQDSVLRRATRSVGLPEQISSTLVDIAGVALPGAAKAAEAIGGLLYGQAKKAIVRHRVLSKCELLSDLLDADADFETLSYFPYLLAWELDRVPSPQVRAMVLLDTFEEVTSQNTRDLERWLQRSVFLMPNVLFVITGRNRLDWADLTRSDELDFVGVQRWPNLQAGYLADEPRQHLVGYLSSNDADGYLAAALTQNDYPAIPTGIRDRIVAASAGLPLYLDLAVTIYLDILARGETPTESDFGQPLPAVAARILRDLEWDERDLLRAAALLEVFDLEALRVACPRVPDSAIRRFKDRPFLEFDPDRSWHYSLHTILRDAIRHADTDLRDSWSARERSDVATRVAAHLQVTATSAAASGDRSTHVAAIRQTIQLCLLTDQFFDWLVEGIQRLLISGGWGLLADLPSEGDGPVSALLIGVQGAKERRSGRLDSSIALMDAALGRSVLPQNLHSFLLLHRAHALRVAGRYADARVDYKILREIPGDFNPDARYWLADYDFLQGRFEKTLSELDQLPQEAAEPRGEILRLRGHVYRVNALFDRAEASYREALGLARETANIGAEGKALTDLVQTLAWCRPADALDIQGRALEVNEAVRNLVEIVKLHAATAVALTGLGRLDEADTEIERGLTLAVKCGYPGGFVWCWVARTFNTIKRYGGDGGREAAAHVATVVDDLRGNRFWSQIVGWWTGAESSDPDSSTRWIEGEDAARARWLAVCPGQRDGV